MILKASAIVALLQALPALGHLALWDPSVFGWTDDPNQSDIVEPLDHLPFDQWWFHGKINNAPKDGVFMELPAGGTYNGQIACNKALTKYGQNDYQQTGIWACEGDGPEGGIGAMHTSDKWESPDPKNVKGTGLSIAYKSNPHAVQPEDFTVVSTNWLSPWKKNVEYHIPTDLPACPEGGCICMWGWIHSPDAGSEQNYVLMYRCKVTGATATRSLPAAKTANKCYFPADTSNCTVGAKQPHFWYQMDHNNNPQGTYDPPYYNGEYGFMDGAQTDLFAGMPAVVPSAAVPTASGMPPTTSTPVDNGVESFSSSTTEQVSSAIPSSLPSTASVSSIIFPDRCRRRKRALERLVDPDVERSHDRRAHKRALRKRAPRSWQSCDNAKLALEGYLDRTCRP